MSGTIPGFPASSGGPKPTKSQAGVTLATGALAGAAAGATIGSIVPGIGTLIGGALGAIAGAVPGTLAMVKATEGGSDHEERMTKFMRAVQQAEQSNLPDAVSAIQSATAQFSSFQALAEQAQGSSDSRVALALGPAVAADQALSSAGNALVDDVNAYSAQKAQVNPWGPSPAQDALNRIPSETAALRAALVAASSANGALAAAMGVA